MNNLIKCELKKTMKRMDSRILMLLSLWPALLSILVIFNDDVFKMEGNALGAFEFTNYMVILQNDIFLPLLLAVVCASVSFYQEISKRTIYFYKDISRENIMKAIIKKYIFILIGIFFMILGVIGLIIPVIPQVPFFVLGVVLDLDQPVHFSVFCFLLCQLLFFCPDRFV